jgi:hypothetical protein
MSVQAQHGLGDPRIPWVVLLDVEIADPPTAQSLATALQDMAGEAGWQLPGPGAVVIGTRRELLGLLASDSSEVVRIGRHDTGLLLAGRHDALDGLALLEVASRLAGSPLTSSARGVDPSRAGGGRLRALARRAWEVAARPPLRVAACATAAGSGDAFAEITVDSRVRTAELVIAGARAVVAWNAARGQAGDRVAVAVGVSRSDRAPHELADHSGFVRLTGTERLDVDGVRQQLAGAGLQPGGAPGRSVLGAGIALLQRLAAPRLGSTLLVSHLGTVRGPDSLHGLAFYPVTGGGSGLSLGAATVDGRTTITLRGRAARYDDQGLDELLALVVDALPQDVSGATASAEHPAPGDEGQTQHGHHPGHGPTGQRE